MTKAASRPSLPSGSTHTLLFLVEFYLLAVVWGIHLLNQTRLALPYFAFQLVFSISLGWWAIVDARLRHHPIPLLARPWFIILAELLVPGYVVWSRGWRGALWLTVNVIMWNLTAALSFQVFVIALHGK